ncbi:MAG TPA: glycosyltransferase [Candidatus Limnocylindria bacterium]|nr:glycosyltransferase [Candidatus Limnocylindria bacterium]
MTNPSLMVVVQRYGDIAGGGAEPHARSLVQRLRPHFDVEVATTTARDYWTWANELTAGLSEVDGVPVRRFAVERGRSRDFRVRERRAFSQTHTLADERAFVEAQGPVAPDLLEHVHRRGREVDHLLFFTYIYYPTVLGLPLAPERAVLVPTAHDEPAIRLAIYKPVFCAPRAIAFNTAEERAMVHQLFQNERVPNEVVGVGVEVPANASAERFRQRYAIEGPYFLYVGRIVESKQCGQLFDAWARWRDTQATRATLVLMGHREMPVPDRPDVRLLGRTSDEDKFDALAGCVALVQPSLLESLSIIVLEAWASGRPVICDARSPVVWGMTYRAGAGLAYRSAAEFAEIGEMLIGRPLLASRLGTSGQSFVARTYTWPRVVETYLDLFAEVRARNT